MRKTSPRTSFVSQTLSILRGNVICVVAKLRDMCKFEGWRQKWRSDGLVTYSITGFRSGDG